MVRVQSSKKSGGGKSARIGVKKSGLKRRRGGSGSGGGGASPGGKIVDARMKIIAKNRSKVVDARDKLVKLAKGTDARQKLQKIRNLREGKVRICLSSFTTNEPDELDNRLNPYTLQLGYSIHQFTIYFYFKPAQPSSHLDLQCVG